jgi:hypothetical protein
VHGLHEREHVGLSRDEEEVGVELLVYAHHVWLLFDRRGFCCSASSLEVSDGCPQTSTALVISCGSTEVPCGPSSS